MLHTEPLNLSCLRMWNLITIICSFFYLPKTLQYIHILITTLHQIFIAFNKYILAAILNLIICINSEVFGYIIIFKHF